MLNLKLKAACSEVLQKGIIYDGRYLHEGYNIVKWNLGIIRTERRDSYKAIKNTDEKNIASSAASFVAAKIRKKNL